MSNLRCLDTEQCQSPDDPFLLLLAVDFMDNDGDLGAGTYKVFVDNQRSYGPNPLSAIFRAQGVSPYETAGTLILPSGISLSGMHSGMTFVVSIELTDFAGNTSNRPGILFQLDIE